MTSQALDSLGLQSFFTNSNLVTTDIVYGNGSTERTNSRLQLTQAHPAIGPLQFLQEPLVSPNALVDNGCDIHLSRQGGKVTNHTTGRSIPIMRNGNRWHIWLRDVISLDDPNPSDTTLGDSGMPTTFHANIVTISKSIEAKVMSLHERMGHPGL